MTLSNPSQYDTLSVTEAVALQKQMRENLNVHPFSKPVKYIGGADISFNKYEETVYAGVVILKYPDMVLVEKSYIISETKFPYISGLLAFREVPALLEVWNKLPFKPDVMMMDGHGIAHKRRMGIAAHFGLLADIPALGCGKSRLTGTFTEPANTKFAESPLMDKEEQIGVVLRSKINCNPIFISPGNKVSMQQAVDITKNCITKYRIPEPTRLAHLWVNEVRTGNV